jgi:hypothetical protein
MAISKTHAKKSPTQNPVDFYLSKQSGGAEGKNAAKVPDKLKGPACREKIYGRKDLG